MVMSTEPQDQQEGVDVIEPAIPEVEPQVETPAEAGEVQQDQGVPEDAPAVEAGPTVVETTPVSEPAPNPSQPVAPPVNDTAVRELQERRQADVQRQWEQQVTRRAQPLERQLNDQGYMPEQARTEARRYIQSEQKIKKEQDQAAEMVGYVQGKQAAAVHFMKQHKLANEQMLNDFMALQLAETPEQMEREARRMQTERSLRAENARLKQQRVEPQTFDNSQGSAEVTTNQDRLYDAYLRGDRSQAAVAAAKKLTLGS